MSGSRSFTGRSRKRQTRWSVQWIDRVARLVIVVGGIGTIAAVCLVCVFLFWVAAPLFSSPRVLLSQHLPAPGGSHAPAQLALDDQQVVGWALSKSGELSIVRFDGQRAGEVLTRRPLFDGPDVAAVSAMSFGVEGPDVAVGFADGTVRLGRIESTRRLVVAEDLPAERRTLPIGRFVPHDDGLLERTRDGKFRWHGVQVRFDEPFEASPGSAVVRIDHSVRSSGPIVCTLADDGRLAVYSIRKTRNLLLRRDTISVTRGELPYEPTGDLPLRVLVTGTGDNVFVIWPNGRMLRYELRNLNAPTLAEETDLVPETNVELTAIAMLVGKTTLVTGDSLGRVRGWFRTKPADAATPDGTVFVLAHDLSSPDEPVTALAPASRSRSVAAGYADGRVRLFYMTTERLLLDLPAHSHGWSINALSIAPPGNGLLAAGAEGMIRWKIDLDHPEVSLAGLFLPAWYEGAERPAHVWQSTGGTVDFEPKFGLVPLIFGTLKATFYSLAFGVPLAILAAIYTSEFLAPRTKATIKPTIELMASLPSVVLGYLAAQVFAPYVEQFVPAVLSSFVTLPMAFLLGALFWQLAPQNMRIQLAPHRLWLVAAVIPLGLLAAWQLGPLVESQLFAGNVKAWLDGQLGDAVGGWMFLLLPATVVATLLLTVGYVNPWLRSTTAQRLLGASRTAAALADLLLFALAVAGSLLVAWALSALAAYAGFDTRGWLVDTYIQRNAMIVGFAMGFAIVPIIYTIAEDALSSVPQHLRSASLGCGATPWQTAVRVVMPTAMSGLFSAVMVGMGRAVGETMIVLMAGGNTPIMELNPFNGFRTLPANLAVELPEAVQNSTHFRVLFLSALVLFVMTFVLNTAAEVVRQRFRKRAVQL